MRVYRYEEGLGSFLWGHVARDTNSLKCLIMIEKVNTSNIQNALHLILHEGPNDCSKQVNMEDCYLVDGIRKKKKKKEPITEFSLNR